MMTIRVSSRTFVVEDAIRLNTLYFFLLRRRIDAVGFDDGREIFRIAEGGERNAEKRLLFVGDPYLWRGPSREEMVGALNQFKNLAALARRMGINRNTITVWKHTGGASFYLWRFLCELLGVQEAVEHSLWMLAYDQELYGVESAEVGTAQ